MTVVDAEQPPHDVPDDDGEPRLARRRRVNTDRRHRGRALALMALYEADTAGHAPEEVVQRLAADERVEPSIGEFAARLVAGVRQERPHLDAQIHRTATQFPVDQLAAVDRNILRIALYEMLRELETPVAVVVSEAVELAQVFGSDTSARFINGVLGALSAERNG